jgi:acetyl-CoA carboxylase carboxyltransferase component
MAMTAGGFHSPLAIAAWPTGEFGAMGLEGAVRLGFKKELEAVPEGAEREALFETLLAQQYAAGSGLNMAATLEIDAVIDPAETRAWLLAGLEAGKVGAAGGPAIDSW